MTKPDVLRITAQQNPKAYEFLTRQKNGDKGECEVHYTIKGSDPEGVDITIEAVVPPGYELDDDATEPEAGMTGPPMAASEPLMTPTAARVRKKMEKPEKPSKAMAAYES